MKVWLINIFSIVFISLIVTPLYSSAKETSFDYCQGTASIAGNAMRAIKDESGFGQPNIALPENKKAAWMYAALQAKKYKIAKALFNMGGDINAITYCKSDRGKPKPIFERLPLPEHDFAIFLVESGLIITPIMLERLIETKGFALKGLSQNEISETKIKLKRLFELAKAKNPTLNLPSVGRLFQFANDKNTIDFIGWLIKERLANGDKQNLLNYAIAQKNDYMIDVLIKSGVHIMGNGEASTPLYYTVLYNNKKLFDFLLKKGEGNYTQLQMDKALEGAYKHPEMGILLLEKGKGLYSQKQLDKTLEAIGLSPRTYFFRQMLLQAGAQPTIENQCDTFYCEDNWHAGIGIQNLLYRNKTITVSDWASENAETTTWNIEPKQGVHIVSTRLNITQSTTKKARGDLNTDCGTIKSGESFEVLNYISEEDYEAFTIRYNKRVCYTSLSNDPEALANWQKDFRAQWWIKIQKPNSDKTAWVEGTEDNFIFLERSF